MSPRFIRAIIFLLWIIALQLSSLPVMSRGNGGWREALIQQGRQQLSWQQEQNDWNDAHGRSEENRYLIPINASAIYPDGDFITQHNGKQSGNYLLDNNTLTELDKSLRTSNESSAIKTYVLVVYYMPLLFSNELPDDQTIEDFFKGRKHALGPSAKEISDEAGNIVESITSTVLREAGPPTLYCGFVNFRFFSGPDMRLSQWVYYPRSSGLEYPKQYSNMLSNRVQRTSWQRGDVPKVKQLIEAIQTNNSTYASVKNVLADVEKITSIAQMYLALADFDETALSAFTTAQRIHILKVLSCGAMPVEIQTLVNKVLSTGNDAEGLMQACLQVNDYATAEFTWVDPTSKIELSQSNIKYGWCLLQCMTYSTSDAGPFFWRPDNYKKLMKNLLTLCAQSESYQRKVRELADTANNNLLAERTIFYNYNSIWRKLASTASPIPTAMLDNTTVLEANCTLKTTQELFLSYLTPNHEVSSKTLSPFEPIVLVNNSSLDMLADLGGGEHMFVAPAIILKYADDKAWNQTAGDATMAVIDIASLATGYGEIKAGVTGLRKAWTLVDMSNAGINLTLNASGASENKKVKTFMEAYNLVTGGASAARMVSGGVKGVYTAVKGKSALRPEAVKTMLLSLEENSDELLTNLAEEDLKTVKTMVTRVEKEAATRGATDFEAQAQRVLKKMEGVVKGEVGKVIYPSVRMNGATVVRILEGSNGKVAIIGRKMSYIEEVAEALRKMGKEVEIFDVNKAFGGQGYKDWDVIKTDWDDAIRQYGILDANGNKVLPYERVKLTLWYQENKRWAKWIKENGYEIYDLGDNPGLLKNAPDRSAFYDLEKKIIFNDIQ